jgi:ATP-dependent protease ClpP protease subunit
MKVIASMAATIAMLGAKEMRLYLSMPAMIDTPVGVQI